MDVEEIISEINTEKLREILQRFEDIEFVYLDVLGSESSGDRIVVAAYIKNPEKRLLEEINRKIQKIDLLEGYFWRFEYFNLKTHVDYTKQVIQSGQLIFKRNEYEADKIINKLRSKWN